MDNEQIQVKNDSQQGPDYIKLLQDIKKYRKTYYKVLAITFVLMAFITLRPVVLASILVVVMPVEMPLHHYYIRI